MISTDEGYFSSLREEYLSSIENLIKKERLAAKDERRAFFEGIKKNPEEQRKKFKETIGIDFFEGERGIYSEEYLGRDGDVDVYRVKLTLPIGITANALLLLPCDKKPPYPTVIAQHGGGGTAELCCDLIGKNNYNGLARRALKRGAAVIAPELMLWSKELTPKYDRGELDRRLKRLGTSITALEISVTRGFIDFAESDERLDAKKLAMIGLSYGGYFTLYTMAADTRIKAGYATGFFNDRDEYAFPDWCYKDSDRLFHDAEVAALCAPRGLYIEVGKSDEVFNYKTAIHEADLAKSYYKELGCEEMFTFSLWGGGHTVSDDDDGYDFIFNSIEV